MRLLPGLKPRDRRALLVGLVLLAPFAAFRFGVAPWLQRASELREVLASEQDLLAREKGVLLDATSFPERTRGLAVALESMDPWLFQGSGTVAAAGALSRYVADRAVAAAILIEEADTRDSATQPTQLEPGGGLGTSRRRGPAPVRYPLCPGAGRPGGHRTVPS